MTARKAAAKKAPAKAAAKKKSAPKRQVEKPADQVVDAKTVTEAAGPEMEGVEYQQGFLGVSSDDEDHSVAAEVARLAEQ